MQFTVSTEAARHYKYEMEPKGDEGIRLFVRVGGVGSGGFSVGVQKETIPKSGAHLLKKEGVTFFVYEKDAWYMDGMEISYNPDIDYFYFQNARIGNTVNPNEG